MFLMRMYESFDKHSSVILSAKYNQNNAAKNRLEYLTALFQCPLRQPEVSPPGRVSRLSIRSEVNILKLKETL